MQKYAGLSFAFGLVEERLFALPGTDRILVQPRILARTVVFGRLFVRADNGISVEPERAPVADKRKSENKARTLTENIFIEEVAGNSALADDLRAFFARLKEADFDLEPSTREQV